jgi:hypothetical protein
VSCLIKVVHRAAHFIAGLVGRVLDGVTNASSPPPSTVFWTPVNKAVGNVKNNATEMLELGPITTAERLASELTPPPWTEWEVLGRGHPGEMASIENIGMGRLVASRGELFCPWTVSRPSDLGEGSVIAAGGGKLAVASRQAAIWSLRGA